MQTIKQTLTIAGAVAGVVAVTLNLSGMWSLEQTEYGVLLAMWLLLLALSMR